MRTISTLVAVTVFTVWTATTTFAQTETKPVRSSQWTIGPKAGMNLSHYWGSDAGDPFNPRLSGQFGGFVTWSNDGWFAITGELLYSGKGARYRTDGFFEDIKGVYRMDYVEIPILFRGFFLTEGRVRPHASIGPSVGFLVLARQKNFEPVETDGVSFYDNVRKVDVGVNVGTGINFEVGNNIWINPEIRYNLGLINVAEDLSRRNGNFAVMLGVGFPIGSAAK